MNGFSVRNKTFFINKQHTQTWIVDLRLKKKNRNLRHFLMLLLLFNVNNLMENILDISIDLENIILQMSIYLYFFRGFF